MSIIMHGEIHGFTDRALWFPLKVDINLSARLNIITTNSLNMQSLKAKQNKTKKKNRCQPIKIWDALNWQILGLILSWVCKSFIYSFINWNYHSFIFTYLLNFACYTNLWSWVLLIWKYKKKKKKKKNCLYCVTSSKCPVLVIWCSMLTVWWDNIRLVQRAFIHTRKKL